MIRPMLITLFLCPSLFSGSQKTEVTCEKFLTIWNEFRASPGYEDYMLFYQRNLFRTGVDSLCRESLFFICKHDLECAENLHVRNAALSLLLSLERPEEESILVERLHEENVETLQLRIAQILAGHHGRWDVATPILIKHDDQATLSRRP